MKTLFFLIVLFAFISSCAVGPKITHSDNYDNSGKLKADKVIIPVFTVEKKIVTDKLTGSYYDPVYNTSSYEFTITTDVRSNNVSLKLSDYLKSRGINAESFTKVDMNQLSKNDYILYGAAFISPVRKAVPWEVFTFFTLVPVILPMPFTSNYGVNVSYYFQIMDKNGKYLQQVDNSLKVMFGSHYLPAGLIRSSNVPSFVHDAAEQELYKILADQFKN